MNQDKPEIVERYAGYAAEHSPYTGELLRRYAAILRGMESAKTSDEKCPECGAPCEASHRVLESGDVLHDYRHTAPMLASARSVEAPAWPGYSQGEPPPKDWTRMDVDNLGRPLDERVVNAFAAIAKWAGPKLTQAINEALAAAPKKLEE